MNGTVKIPYSEVLSRKLIHEGDVLLFRGSSFFSRLIQVFTEGIHTHAGMASWNGDILELVEFRENYGGRVINLYNEVLQRPDGIIDIFRPSPYVMELYLNTDTFTSTRIKRYNGKSATNEMRKLTGLPYGWRRLFEILKFKIPFIRLFLIADLKDDKENGVYPVCSTAVAAAIRKCYTDLVHLRPDQKTTPSDLARSPLLHYLFTISQK